MYLYLYIFDNNFVIINRPQKNFINREIIKSLRKIFILYTEQNIKV